MFKSAYLDENKLIKALERAFDQLKEKGLLPADAKKETIIDQVISNIKNGNERQIPEMNITGNNKSLMNALNLMLISEYVNSKAPDVKFNYAKLFKDLPQLTPGEKKDLQKELAEELKAQLTAINKKLAKDEQQDQKKIDQAAEILADRFINQPNDSLLKDNEKMEMLATMMSVQELSLRSQYGGINPGETGQQAFTVYEIKANEVGFMNFTMGLADSFSAMDERNRYDSSQPDYLGDEMAVLQNQIGMGATNEALETELINDGVLKSMSPRMKGPGGREE